MIKFFFETVKASMCSLSTSAEFAELVVALEAISVYQALWHG